jgi:hypothetical protein
MNRLFGWQPIHQGFHGYQFSFLMQLGGFLHDGVLIGIVVRDVARSFG